MVVRSNTLLDWTDPRLRGDDDLVAAVCTAQFVTQKFVVGPGLRRDDETGVTVVN